VLAAGANINSRNGDPLRTSIYLACACGDGDYEGVAALAIARLLLSSVPPPDLSLCDADGVTALREALYWGEHGYTTISLLTANGAVITDADRAHVEQRQAAEAAAEAAVTASDDDSDDVVGPPPRKFLLVRSTEEMLEMPVVVSDTLCVCCLIPMCDTEEQHSQRSERLVLLRCGHLIHKMCAILAVTTRLGEHGEYGLNEQCPAGRCAIIVAEVRDGRRELLSLP